MDADPLHAPLLPRGSLPIEELQYTTGHDNCPRLDFLALAVQLVVDIYFDIRVIRPALLIPR